MTGFESIAGWTEGALWALLLVFARVAAAVALLPGFGDRMLPVRVQLAGTLAFTAIVWPMVAGTVAPPETWTGSITAIVTEIVVGALIGLSVRFLVFALQFAGSIAAQSTSLAQVFAGGPTPDPMPALGNVLYLAGATLALVFGLHLRFIEALALSYDAMPLGFVPEGRDVADWGLAHGRRVFSLGFSLALPFVLAALVYNLALGAINRAMPQLMVTLVGAPAITGITLLLLLMSAPLVATVWADLLMRTVDAPFEAPR